MADRVTNMVCVACGRLHGQEHHEGCPETLDWTATRREYRDGWDAARFALLPAFADRVVELRAALTEALAYRRVGRMPQDVLERLREVLDG